MLILYAQPQLLNDILTLVTVASGNSTLHMIDLKNNVSGQENTVITTIGNTRYINTGSYITGILSYTKNKFLNI